MFLFGPEICVPPLNELLPPSAKMKNRLSSHALWRHFIESGK